MRFYIMIHSFLLIGQSNMAGRGFINEVEPIKNPHIKVLRNGRWQTMYVPVNCDREFSGISLAESFADIYQKEHNVDVGLIPCADGGTSLAQWKKGSLLFDNAIYQTRLAERTSTLAGVLWHQGEGDCNEKYCDAYEEKFTEFLENIKKELNLTDVPFLVGGLGDFLVNYNDSFKQYSKKVNSQLKAVAEKSKMTGFVSAEGLLPNPDNLHFCAKSLREFGIRYYEEFKKLEDSNKIFQEKPSEDDALRTEMELL